MPADAIPADELLGRKALVPSHVVYRDFVTETVVLNLETGEYHGLNRTGGLILAVLERAETIGAAARTLADQYGRGLGKV
jgi:Coenzyme PQQ synthesis protein D (PqqD)